MSDPRHKLLIPQGELPLSAMTLSRLRRGKHKDSAGFPKPKRIGQRNYYDAEAFWRWWSARETPEVGVCPRKRAA